jgi:hypothetical protein
MGLGGGAYDSGDVIEATATYKQLSSTGTGASGGLQTGLRLGGCARHAAINVNRGEGERSKAAPHRSLEEIDWGPELRG